ncbi:hypothetical protein [Pseudoxanthomonas sp. 10H]|uniref:hypothetical protein n=1 Tax=Pseudoxanthomonas sp. 10H TaxID=3242729 RepID=UPI003558CE9C
MAIRDRLDARCPRCGGRALFVEPYVFSAKPVAEAGIRRWGGWHIRERYPALLPWQAPKGSTHTFLTDGPSDGQGYRLLHRGVVECARCGPPFVHTLAWPDDAWWQWSIRGRLLWAWDREHALQILAYVRASDRPPRSTSGPLGSIPSDFLTAKARPAVVKAIERSLGAAG